MIPIHLSIALNEIGVTEIPGAGNNARIAEYLKSVGLPGIDKIPHCAAFANWVVEGGDYSDTTGVPGTESGLARSFLNWGYSINKPKLGCIVVLKRGTDPRKGHVGFYLDHSRGFIRILGANQGDRVGVNAYSGLRLLSYRWHSKWE
jgi:uncharacterized protein (TIGR02594 family)